MTQSKTSETTSNNQDVKPAELDKNQVKKEKENLNTKVVIRRLPPTMTLEVFLEQISPVPDNDYLYFVKADMSLGIHAFSRAYINFLNQEEVYSFKDKFDSYVFLDSKGNEFSAIVEFAPFQKVPKKKLRKKDAKCGTIDQDPDYLKFLEELTNPKEVVLPTMDSYLEEIETKERERKANNGVPKVITPLLEYLKQKRVERQRIKEEKREERRRRDLERRRLREEERKRRKAEKERERELEKEKAKEKEKEKLKAMEDKSKGEPQVKLLKNPERSKDKSRESDEKEDKSGSERGKDNKDNIKERPKTLDRERRDSERERERRKERERERERQRERQKQREPERDRLRNRQIGKDDKLKCDKFDKLDSSQEHLEDFFKSTKSPNRELDVEPDKLEERNKFKSDDNSRYRYDRDPYKDRRRDDRKRDNGSRLETKSRIDDYRRDRGRLDEKSFSDYVRVDRSRLDDRIKSDRGRYDDRWRSERNKVEDKVRDRIEEKNKMDQDTLVDDSAKESRKDEQINEENEMLELELKISHEESFSDINDKCKDITTLMDQNKVEWMNDNQEIERSPSSQSSDHSEEGKSKEDKAGSGDDSKADKPKDVRAERRIRNKDRPAMQLYQPGQRRFSSSRNSPSKEVTSFSRDAKSQEDVMEDLKSVDQDASPFHSEASSNNSL